MFVDGLFSLLEIKKNKIIASVGGPSWKIVWRENCTGEAKIRSGKREDRSGQAEIRSGKSGNRSGQAEIRSGRRKNRSGQSEIHSSARIPIQRMAYKQR